MQRSESQRRAIRRVVASERARRLAEFDALYAAAARAREAVVGAALTTLSGTAEATARLPVLAAEGDSWFDYPLLGSFGRTGGVVSGVAARLGVPILNLAHAGDEAREMLGVEQRRRLRALFKDERRPLDGLLFSGGGNDIVGNQLAVLLRDDTGQPAANAFYEDRLDAALALVFAAFSDLRALRDEWRPACVLFVHAYDVGYPDGSGVCGFGPWLKPPLDERGWKDLDRGRAVLRCLLERFRDRLQAFCAQDATGRTVLVPTLGTLTEKRDWHNELHPNREGFAKIAERFATVIRARLME